MSAPLRFVIFVLLGFLAALALPTPARAGEDWLPVTPEELKMTSELKAPGAQAIYLYRQLDRDDPLEREQHYDRIKIFTDEGRSYADVEIPFVKGRGDIKNIQARTIHPDGSIVNFEGKVYEKMVVKAKGVKFLAKTFTVPDVQAGSIVEYRYTRTFEAGYIFDSQWLLSEDLFTKRAKFSLHCSSLYALAWSFPAGLPVGTNPPQDDHNMIRLEAQDIPAFQIEDYMPPQNEMKYRVDFRYQRSFEKDPDKFWKEEAKRRYRGIELFIDKRKAMEQAVAQIVSPGDAPEQKLQKLYARCQKIRNTSYEHEKTQQEAAREKLKSVENVEDIWKRGYSGDLGINWLFLAMARAAGFEASPVLISTRDTNFFQSKLMNADDLNIGIVMAKVNGKEVYFNPGVAFAPYAVLPWEETDVPGMLIDKEGGTWITTTALYPTTSGIQRDADFQLDDEGSLEGRVTVTYNGIPALGHRLDQNEADAAERKKSLEDELKEYVPVPIEAELTNQPDWSSSSNTLVAEFRVKVPGWGSAAGRRKLLPAELFGGDEKHVFESANRVHPLYFHYPFTDVDNVTITLPPDWQASNLPAPQQADVKLCVYGLTAENKGGALHISRHLMMNIAFLEAKYYPTLRNFYQAVRSGDEQQIVLSSPASAH
jgi:hypothetical protein